MNLFRMGGPIYNFCQAFMMIAYLNFLWILFTLMGGIFLGIHPATVALFLCLKKWKTSTIEKITFRTFKRYFLKEFKQANLLGIFLNGLVVLSFYNGFLLYINKDSVQPFLVITYMISLLLFVVILLYIYPIYALFRKRIIQTISLSIIIGLSHPFSTLFLMITQILLGIVIYGTSGLPLFFGVSALAYATFFFTFKIYENMREKIVESSTPI